MFNAKGYQKRIKEDIVACLEDMSAQPILFIGSGMSKRYFGAPNWIELLKQLAEKCPNIERDFGYYNQKYEKQAIGSIFSERYQEWAWTEGKNTVFPSELFIEEYPPDIYIKHMIANILNEITPQSISQINPNYHKEIKLLQDILPHAIITTNYDMLLENLFPDYSPIIGQRILRGDSFSVGEIFKIHGCVSSLNTLIFHEEDYEDFQNKKKYLSAKLLTYFAEHPLIFIGYSAEDRNIRNILSDIDEILAPRGELIPNIYMLEWSREENTTVEPATEKLIPIDDNRSVRVKSILSHNFDWVFEAFGATTVLDNFKPKHLRTLLARNFELVRTEIPKKSVEINYENLESILEDEDGISKLYGITVIDDPKQFALAYPHSLTAVGKKLGYSSWHGANGLIERIYEEKGFNLKGSDNEYHIALENNGTITMRKYSDKAVTLLQKVKNNEEYYVNKK